MLQQGCLLSTKLLKQIIVTYASIVIAGKDVTRLLLSTLSPAFITNSKAYYIRCREISLKKSIYWTTSIGSCQESRSCFSVSSIWRCAPLSISNLIFSVALSCTAKNRGVLLARLRTCTLAPLLSNSPIT